MSFTAGWCRLCDGPVWLPHEHADEIVVEYDAGKAPRISRSLPRSPELLEIKRYRRGVAAELIEAGGIEEAIAVLEDLIKHVDRDASTEDERIIDYAILGDLAYCLVRSWRLEQALAVLGRVPLNTRRLEKERHRCLGLRGIVHARMGETFYAERDRDRLYAHDPRHPLIEEINREIASGVEIPRYAPQQPRKATEGSSTD